MNIYTNQGKVAIAQKADVLIVAQKITMQHNVLTLPRTMHIGRTTKFLSKTLTVGSILEQAIMVAATGSSSLDTGANGISIVSNRKQSKKLLLNVSKHLENAIANESVVSVVKQVILDVPVQKCPCSLKRSTKLIKRTVVIFTTILSWNMVLALVLLFKSKSVVITITQAKARKITVSVLSLI